MAYNLLINRILNIMYNNRSRGFTLIELLVVIAIIGILSAVVLASLNTARSKGNDAAIQSNLSTIQTQAEVFYTPSVGYAGVCTSSVVAKALASADTANANGSVGCTDATGSYKAYSALVAAEGKFWCVDNTGDAVQLDAAPTGASCR
jgi:prepilin-type N-terminal cleavage/methylation domain-containing protein